MSLVLLTPSSPGWFIWAIPFLVIYQCKGDHTAIYLTLSFSLVYLFNILFDDSKLATAIAISTVEIS